MLDVRKLIEEINSMTEEEFVDNFDDLEVSDMDLVEEPQAEADTTESLDAKTKISRALDVLAAAIEDFKNATVSELDLVADADLNVSFESLDNVVSDIRGILTGNQEAKSEPLEVESAPIEEEPIEDEEEGFEEVDFDTEAALDLFDDESEDEDEEAAEEE